MAREYRRLLWVFTALLTLLALTVGSSLLALGAFNPIINIAIAFSKVALIFWFFMELRDAQGLVRLFAVAAGCWLILLFALGGADFLTR